MTGNQLAIELHRIANDLVQDHKDREVKTITVREISKGKTVLFSIHFENGDTTYAFDCV